jgi:hypothetical protein
MSWQLATSGAGATTGADVHATVKSRTTVIRRPFICRFFLHRQNASGSERQESGRHAAATWSPSGGECGSSSMLMITTA